MKTRFSFYAVVLFFVALAGCGKAELQNPGSPEPNPEPLPPAEETVIFSATAGAPVSRTELSGDGSTYSLLWKAGDAIKVNATTLGLVADDDAEGYGAGTQNGHFSGPRPQANGSSPLYKAIYPASLRDAYGYCNLPIEQNYVPGNIDAFPMYAESDEAVLSFRNLCGIICLNLKGDASVKSISLADKSAEPIPMSGRFTVSENAAVMSSGTNGTALICGTPVALNTESFTPFFITVPAGSYGTLQIIIEASDGSICKKTSNKPIVVERSRISPINLSSLEFKDESAKIVYTTRSGNQKFGKYANGADASVFGQGLTVVSHDYDNDTRTGVISLSGPVTTIGNDAFRSGSNGGYIQTVTIPNTVTSIGTYAFYGCGSLESINFPRSLTTIGRDAFVNCTKLVPDDMSHLTSIGIEAFQNTAISGIITIPEGLTLLGDKAFSGCTGITEVLWSHTPATLGYSIFYNCDNIESVTFAADLAIPGYMFDNCDKLATVNYAANVTAIGDYAFNACRALESFVIPETVGAVGKYAFGGCRSLESIDFGNITSLGEQAFVNCTSLTEVVLPSTLTKMYTNGTFKGCTSLIRVVLPENAAFTTIPQYCFSGCTNLVSISIPSNITSIEAYTFQNCGLTSLPEGWGRTGIAYGTRPYEGCPIVSVTFPDTWNNVPAQFCASWKQLREVHLGSGVTRLNDGAFSSCTSLTDGADIVIPSQITSIGTSCFEKSGLTSLPSGLNRSDLSIGVLAFGSCPLVSVDISSWTSVPNRCFESCASLSSVTLGQNLLSLAGSAFRGCSSLTSISLPASLNSIGDYCFDGTGLTALPAGFKAYSTMGGNVFSSTAISTVVIPNGVTILPGSTFAECAQLQSVDLNGVETLGSYAFKNCRALSSITAGSVRTIGANAFEGTTSLTSINLPVVETLDNYVFSACTALRTVDLGSAVRSLKLYLFHNCNILEAIYIRNVSQICSLDRYLKNSAPYPLIYVPAGLLDDYKTADYWSQYADNFRSIDDITP